MKLFTSLPEKIFVTGTDTGVGKTYISALLMKEMNAYYWKPIQAGTPTDTNWIKDNHKISPERFIKERYLLNNPLSPHLAAKLDGVEIDLDSIELPKVSPLVVEGCGGVLVPINDRYFVVDLIKKLGLPVLVVARSSLGTINHTLLTLKVLRDRGVDILGVFLNGEKNQKNEEAIAQFGKVKIYV